MTDQYLADESGIESSQPREIYDIVQSSAVTHHIASGQQDIVFNGITYKASPASRSNVGMPGSGQSQDITPTLILPLSHPFCQRYASLGVPPQQCTVTIWRKQLNSGLVEQIWFGYVTSMSFDSEGAQEGASDASGASGGHVAKFTIPSRLARNLTRNLPVINVARVCAHVLYDQQCTINPSGFSTSTTVAQVNGNQVTVNATFPSSDYTIGGDLKHTPTGEIQTIVAQAAAVSGTTLLTLQAPIPDLKQGDAVVVRAGCAHDVGTCATKFSNAPNFGGFPDMPINNPTIPASAAASAVNGVT
jgi:hypothetical protein